jgi:hypothetical protein
LLSANLSTLPVQGLMVQVQALVVQALVVQAMVQAIAVLEASSRLARVRRGRSEKLVVNEHSATSVVGVGMRRGICCSSGRRLDRGSMTSLFKDRAP